MNTKLTIKLDNDVISRAKRYAEKRRTSLSKMIESYLDAITKPDKDDIEITPLVKSLSGIISLPEDYDYKKDRTEYLIKKYL
jgi:macrodomain Ter protein organizer (MatP/YcbG family)